MPADSVARPESGNDSAGNGAEAALSTSPGNPSVARFRTDSESSDKVMRFVLPSVDGSPPKVITMDEVATVFKNIQSMELAHEIALNPEFKLQPYQPPEDSLEQRIKDIMHRAFWDVLREQLGLDPPCYDHAIQLLGDIKECFPQILSRNNQRALDHINEVLDTAIIRQQAEKGVLDFKAYADFIIRIMAKSCAPLRDDDVQRLAKIDDVVDMFRGILETMSLIKLDMVNYLLDQTRNDILRHSVEYEKEKFNEYLEYYKFGFPATEKWLKRNLTLDADNKPCSVGQAITNAYLELMDWDENEPFPEVLQMDQERLLKLSQRARRLCCCAAFASIAAAVPAIAQRADYRVMIAAKLEIILQGVTNEKELSEIVGNVWELIKTEANGLLEGEHNTRMDAEGEETLKAEVYKITEKTSIVRSLFFRRLKTYFNMMLAARGNLPPTPPGYQDFAEELEGYTKVLRRVITYNHSVFGEYFDTVLRQYRPSLEATTSEEEAPTVNDAAASPPE